MDKRINRDQFLLDAVMAQRDVAINAAAELAADKHVGLARIGQLEARVAELEREVEELRAATPVAD